MRTSPRASDLSGIKGDFTQRERDSRLGILPNSTKKMHATIDAAESAAERRSVAGTTALKLLTALAAAGITIAGTNEVAKSLDGRLPSAHEAAEKVLGRKISE